MRRCLSLVSQAATLMGATQRRELFVTPKNRVASIFAKNSTRPYYDGRLFVAS
jgi:hypothetical protein